ncbi:MAG: hypothetical protein A2252_10980 [Elusimicrobia bacterium RIFOXYA2_FULL_39_19]|nr:MAG: hypothetical protein A2252_10980 [Elusimicrobia bacterium RIFOXYA2_FULL_39_19]
MTQIHKRFTDEQIKNLVERYLKKEIERKYIQEILGIGKSRFFKLVAEYKKCPDKFSIKYERATSTKIPQDIEHNIIKELNIEKKLIEDKNVPLKSYNYSYIKDRLKNDYHQEISLPTIIDRAKKNDFYLNRPKRKAHDREVLTNYAGELIQHDSSHHQWSPYASEKWYLITSLDDYSRFMLHASLVKHETSWNHILAMESIFLKYGLPYSFYVDSHSIFRFVQGRDSVWREHIKLTDQANPQWKQVLTDCNVKIIYALSPQAKGKIERPYGWLQDRIVRTCARENVSDIKQAQNILNHEIHRYNYRQVHSTTLEVPYFRFKKALSENKTLFRDFSLKQPFVSSKDIFCLRFQRTTDAYRKICFNDLSLRINADPHKDIELRISPVNNTVSEVRCWFQNKLIDVLKIKNIDLDLVSTFHL